MKRYLFDKDLDKSSCGVGFITHKQSLKTHQLIQHAHQALCMIPHRGGMNAEGIGDGAGVNIDLSLTFFRKVTKQPHLELGAFGVANFFLPNDSTNREDALSLISRVLTEHNLEVITTRDVATDSSVLNPESQKAQLAIKQFVFSRPVHINSESVFESLIHQALEEIELHAFTSEHLRGLYPLSMSSQTQVLKGRLNSWEVIPYFKDLSDPEQQVHTLFFHTRFSTNTAPNPMFAQPFRRMAHNGELNTDRKNRLSENAIAKYKNKRLIFPAGQSDSARLDQTLARRVIEDDMPIDVAALAMMPPAWENDESLSKPVRAMLEYFSLYEEKNDGPAAFIFGDGVKVGARLDRLGLRPLRSVETHDYLAVMSEAGQIDFPDEEVIRRGRIEAGGMIVFDHQKKEIKLTAQIMEELAAEHDYAAMLNKARLTLAELPTVNQSDVTHNTQLNIAAQHVAYSMNQESFKFMLDPMLQDGSEKISAMGYGLAPNVLTREEGGVSRYFSQRFAQVTNPPLDSIREVDGMTLRVALGAKPNISPTSHRQIVLNSPLLKPQDLAKISAQTALKVSTLPMLFNVDPEQADHQQQLLDALKTLACRAEQLAQDGCDIIILSDQAVTHQQAAIPALLAVATINQKLIAEGLRFNTSLVCHTGQAASTHDLACLLGFGASAVCPITVYNRAVELFENEQAVLDALARYQKAAEKALMKTMGKFGLCTVESYIGGEFFEANFIDTHDPLLKAIFPNIHSPVGGARFKDLVESAVSWHKKVFEVQAEDQIPVLGLFKERAQGAGHSFGTTAVREYINMTEEKIQYIDESQLESTDTGVILPEDDGYKDLGFEARTPEQIAQFKITQAYREFSHNLLVERHHRPAALRDVLALPLDFTQLNSTQAFIDTLKLIEISGSFQVHVRGLNVEPIAQHKWLLSHSANNVDTNNYLAEALNQLFKAEVYEILPANDKILIETRTNSTLDKLCSKLVNGADEIFLSDVQPAHEITATFASGAMSHGALVEKAHEAVAQGTNIAGAMSNSGEGGENSRRYNTVKASKIKQFASGRFGVWTGYLADPALQEIEIKIGQGAKPGEGGQLPAPKVNVVIAAARGGTPGVELVSPPPHHDTYSIEDLGQLIHDAKAARVRVIVKLVSSEGIGTIAVGVAKAGADVINVAGNTGGTGAAQVTSLKHTGRAADIGIAEVHQALAENGLRDKITLRCSNAHQTGSDVVKSAMLGGDSFEFGTTALMMLKCVMAKNCNLKCPAGLTTNPEVYRGDPRALAQYFMNVAHEVREILASIGYRSLAEVRGRSDLLHLISHPAMVGKLDMTAMLKPAQEIKITTPIYLEANFDIDSAWLQQLESNFLTTKLTQFESDPVKLNNCNKTVGGQLAIDIERILNYRLSDADIENHPAIMRLENGRKTLKPNSIKLHTTGSAGQSYGAFNNSGMFLQHIGTCNDGVGKGASGGQIVVTSGNNSIEENVLIGNFALFGATGGQLYVNGQAGDRFGVRNSGAVAVIEGVGDFCCEYMTNGAIVNIGTYGKGFGNGMSGGTAYQYDPSGRISELCSQDSVTALHLGEDDALCKGQEQALLQHLTDHVTATRSLKVQALLDDWQTAKQHFYVLIPNALFQYHCADRIEQTLNRRAMLEELSQGWAEKSVKTIKHAYQDYHDTNISLFDGELPAYGDCDTDLVYRYISSAGILHRADQLVQKQHAQGYTEVNAHYLFDTLDHKLIDALAKDAKEALASYDDQALSCLLAQKRVQDYKDALSLREVCDSPAIGTSVWIIHRDKAVQQALLEYRSLNELLATHYCHVLSEAVRHAA
ncbi:glutamate synthase-related protein [Pseudoalteromonas luteoviolacea]|uniref:glutamate synthase-related protein n=1 Tax=Pseudoalteromonas luteoviolacea TaxID=43657 RepID=UPI001F46C523|nr:glutamate synthase-related protein [Pseudoalteromonas luteoviolacea]MCF6439767.1 glutamate synthase-related protein [Pseudoalteromonas luteoviolacea]